MEQERGLIMCMHLLSELKNIGKFVQLASSRDSIACVKLHTEQLMVSLEHLE